MDAHCRIATIRPKPGWLMVRDGWHIVFVPNTPVASISESYEFILKRFLETR